MPSRTTLWRRKKSREGLSSRGRHTKEDRQDRLIFVGAVAAQLLKHGQASHYGLRACPQRIDFDPAKQPKVRWLTPSDGVWKEIEASSHNADCLALAAAFIGKVAFQKRPKSLLGKYHRDTRAKRESSRVIYWQSIPGMTKQTAHYWRERRKLDYQEAVKWLASLLKKHGLRNLPTKGEATLIRDDLADYLNGERITHSQPSEPRFLPSSERWKSKVLRPVL